LFVRWSIAIPAVIATDEAAPEALARSWNGTKANFWPILAALVVVYAPSMLSAFIVSQTDVPVSALAFSIAFNLVTQASVIGGWHVSIAIYALICGREGLAEVFE
jgi:hypothetical protein